jgi:hypothetical protein
MRQWSACWRRALGNYDCGLLFLVCWCLLCGVISFFFVTLLSCRHATLGVLWCSTRWVTAVEIISAVTDVSSQYLWLGCLASVLLMLAEEIVYFALCIWLLTFGRCCLCFIVFISAVSYNFSLLSIYACWCLCCFGSEVVKWILSGNHFQVAYE